MNGKRAKRARQAARVNTADGFANIVQRSGYGADNSLSAGTYVPSELLTRNRMKLEWMYRQNWVAGVLVDAVAEDMTRAGIEITGGLQPDQQQDIQTLLTRMGVWDALLDTVKWSRLYGGCLAIMQLAGQDPSTPLNLDTIGIGQFQGMAVYDRWMIQPDLTRLIPSGPMIGLPAYYRIVTSYGANGAANTFGQTVHHSRVVRMIGIKLPAYQAMTEEYWGESVIERMYDRLLAFDTATMGAANLIDKAHLRMIGINGLREILSMGGPAEENLLKMFSYVRQMQTNEGITLLDKEDAWQTSTYSFSGLSDMMIQFNQQLTGSARIPIVRMFGQSPAGLNATGESDMRMYYDNINSAQESTMRTPVETILQVAHRSLYGTPLPASVQFKFAPLWQMSNREKSDTAKVTAETVIGAVEAGLIDTATGMKELRQQSDETGIFTNITDEAIEEAEMAPPPSAVAPATPDVSEPGEPASDVKPSVVDRIKAFLGKVA
jgi:hypothetical protein